MKLPTVDCTVMLNICCSLINNTLCAVIIHRLVKFEKRTSIFVLITVSILYRLDNVSANNIDLSMK